MNITKHNLIISTAALSLILAFVCVGQTPKQNETLQLPPNQTIEREMTGAETHRYKFDLKAGEFFQARVEQKGVDVALKLTDAVSGKVLATMDSPNGKAGFETISFVAAQAGSFILEVPAPEAKAEKGSYILTRVAARQATAADKRRVEIERFFAEGITARDAKQTEVATVKLKESLKGWRELDDKYLTDLTEKQIKAIKLKPITDALVAEFTLPQQLVTEGQKLMREGTTESFLKAQSKLNEAVELSRKFYKKLEEENLTDILSKATKADWKLFIKLDEANGLSGLGSINDFLRNWEEAVNYNKLAVTVIEEMRQNPEIRESQYFSSAANLKAQEAGILDNIGSTLSNYLNKPQAGIAYANQALALWQEVQAEDKKFSEYGKFQESLTLFQLGQKYKILSERQKALDYFKKSLEIVRTVPNQRNQQAIILMEISNVYDSELNYAEGLEYQKNALKIYEETKDKPSQANILQLIGLSYFNLNDKAKAREYFNQTLAILLADNYLEYFEKQKIGIPFPQDFKTEDFNLSSFQKDLNEWNRNVSVGSIYGFLGEKDKQLQFLEKSLISARPMKQHQMIELSLSLIGSYYTDKKDWQNALNYYKQALEASRRLPKDNSAGELSNIAYVYFEMKNWQNSLQNANEALVIYQSLGANKDKLFTGYGTVLNTAARTYWELGNRRLAIFYGKQAVNAIQRERRQLQNLDAESQRGYLTKNEKPYRRLADWLIAEGRFSEAQQVLAMLKEKEYSEYVRRDADEIKNLQANIKLKPDEQKLVERYNLLAGRVTAIGAEFQTLDDKKKRLPEGASLPTEEQKRYEELTAQLADANTAFKLFLEKELVAEFGKTVKKEIDVDRALQESLRSFGDGTVALYTIAGEERYRVILTTPTVQVDGKTEIKAADLNKKIFAFRAALQNPGVDLRPLGKELYDILIKPIEKDLEAAKAKTLVWSLDGALRYIPLAALSPDGEHYLVEKYATALITSATRQNLTTATEKDWRALGLGVSTAETVADPIAPDEKINFGALPNVKTELANIIHETAKENGLLEGKRLVDADFNSTNFADALTKETADGKRKYSVVHIASHFRLGDDAANSFLLLGGGNALTLEQISSQPQMRFGGVELVTLSACNTAFGSEATGKEVDSLATFIELRGAKSVMATLWSVADESTQILMSEFYRLHKENPQMSKAESLREAQLNLLKGKINSGKSFNGHRSNVVNLGDEDDAQKPFVKNPTAPFAHPFYWSPVILIGNWR